jgi:tRNA G37 N-methylase Trm5
LKFRCHFKDNTPEYKLVFQGRRYDNWHLRKLRPFLRANGTFIDVGANFGFFALNAAKAMGNRCKVIAIEPNGTMANRLRENIRLNGFDCITVREVAVGETHGFASGRFGAGDHGLRGYGRVEASALVDQPILMLPLLSIVRDAGI